MSSVEILGLNRMLRNIVRISLSEWFDLTGTNLANTISRYFAHQLLTLRHHKLGCNYDV